MNKLVLIAAIAMLIVGTAFTSSAIARDRGDRADRNALTASQIVAPGRRAHSPYQKHVCASPDRKNWPGLETALHDIGKTRADRLIAFRADREQRNTPSDIIEHLNNRSKFLGERSADLKKLAVPRSRPCPTAPG